MNVLVDLHLLALYDLFFGNGCYWDRNLLLVHLVYWNLDVLDVFSQWAWLVLWLWTVLCFVFRFLVLYCFVAFYPGHSRAGGLFLCCCWLCPRLLKFHRWVLFWSLDWCGRYLRWLYFLTWYFSLCWLLFFYLLFLCLFFFLLSWCLYCRLRIHYRRRRNVCFLSSRHWSLSRLYLLHLLQCCYLLHWWFYLFWPLLDWVNWVYRILSYLFWLYFSTIDSQHVRVLV